MSFHWRGKNKQGVSRWVGSWNAPPRWFGQIFFGYGILAGCAGVSLLLYALVTRSWPPSFSVLTMVALTHALAFGGSGAWMLRLRRHILSLSQSKQVSEFLGVDELSVPRIAEERGIKPRLNVNGQDLYELSDFTEAAILLRASVQPPEAKETLLRPAIENSDTPASELLRPDSNTDPQSSYQQSTSYADEEQNILIQRSENSNG